MDNHVQPPYTIDDRPCSDWIFVEPCVCQIERSAWGSRELADFIVKATACHGPLVDALREVLDVLGALSNPTELCGWAIPEDRAREIVALVSQAEEGE